MMKKTLALLLAALLCVSSIAPAFAQDIAIAKTVELNKHIFEDKMQLTGEFVTMLENVPGEVVTLTAKDYAFTIKSDEIVTGKKAKNYNLKIERLTKQISAFDKAVGERTPKYVLDVKSEITFPAPIAVTVRESNFMPGSTLYAYKLVRSELKDGLTTNVFTAVSSAITVAQNGDYTFTITDGGKYLISTKQVMPHSNFPNPFAFDRPELVSVNSLITYLDEDPSGYFSAAFKDEPTESTVTK